MRAVLRTARRSVHAHAAVIGMAASAALVGAGYVFWLSAQVPAELLDPQVDARNVWFQADLGRAFEAMTSRSSSVHERSSVHPLHSLLAFPPSFLLIALGETPLMAVRVFTAATAGVWLAGLFVALIAMGLRRLDAALFTLLAASTSATIFTAPIPEAFLLGSLSVVTVAALSARPEIVMVKRPWATAASTFSLSVTVTNWVAGILSTFSAHGFQRCLRISRDAFLIVTLLWGVQKLLFPASEFFLTRPEPRDPVLIEAAGGPLERTCAFFLHSVAMPAVQALDNPFSPGWPLLSVQRAPLSSHAVWSLAAVVVWVALLGLGAAMLLLRANRALSVMLAGTIAFQYLLHLVNGDDSLLHSLHWVPLLVMVAAAATLLPHARIPVLGCVAALTAALAINNLDRFLDSTALLRARVSKVQTHERAKLRAAMAAAPDAGWPRGTGHVLLGAVGSDLENKGYHEPGGSFSPGFGSFGISFAILDRNAELLASSNNLPLSKIEQGLGQTTGGAHTIGTRTPFYEARWAVVADGHFRLWFRSKRAAGERALLRITSSGPSGGPLESVRGDGQEFVVDNRWRLSFDPAPSRLGFGEESRPPSPPSGKPLTQFKPVAGFGAVTFELAAGEDNFLDVRRLGSAAGDAGTALPVDEPLAVTTPDARFDRSLFAQLAHLQMGVIGTETRPGDPARYTAPSLREATYVIVALVRAGEIGLAQDLVAAIAYDDFFGTSGSEADAPGLAIWALDEVAKQDPDGAFGEAVWPHVERKQQLILEMLQAGSPISRPFVGPVAAELCSKPYAELSTIAQQAHGGLIRGRLSLEQPLFFVNAVSYLGLRHAAALAERLGHLERARSIRERAGALRRAYRSALSQHPDRGSALTAAAGLWPSLIADADGGAYAAVLEQRWARLRSANGSFEQRPERTYLDVAEAHQWLRLDRSDRVWATIDWLFAHQSSPGLFTWWEHDAEGASGRWPEVRGWPIATDATPHYWTAAEMALLQLEMLALERPIGTGESCADMEVVLGAGVPRAWISRPISVRGIRLGCGRVDWRWDGRSAVVHWHGDAPGKIRLGSAFPADAEVQQW